jgi:hypothetical protein
MPKHIYLLALLAVWFCLAASAAHAAIPCDFKGLSVGDNATPQEIMRQFGIAKYITKKADEPNDEQHKAASDDLLERAKKVGSMNAVEEETWNRGPACGETNCEIPFGVSVGNEPYSIPVGVFVAFDGASKITGIDVRYDFLQWDDVLELLNTKYGNNWDKEETPFVVTDYETKKSQPFVATLLRHRNVGTNPKTGDTCSITAQSMDRVFLHTTPPIYRSVLSIELISKNF